MVNAILVILALAAAPASADQSSPAPNRSQRFATQRPSPNDPYKKLFEPQASVAPRAPEQTGTTAKPRVVCGMTMIPADPAIDPKILVPLPAVGIDYKLRTIDPAICSPSK
jgi:hypothetical protein